VIHRSINTKVSKNMPYLISTEHGDRARVVAGTNKPIGAGIEEPDLNKVEVLEVWGSSFNDEGPDYTRFIAKDSSGVMIAQIDVVEY
jgi:hypothetical protein